MADTCRPSAVYPTGGPLPSHSQPQAHPYYVPQPPILANPSNSRTCKFRSPFLQAFFGGMILIVIIAAVIYIVEWLIFRPLLPEFRVDSFQLANFSVAAESLSALWVAGFSVNNPNKKLTISYDNVESSIHYRSKFLSQTRIHHFTVGKKNQTTVIANFAADSIVDLWLLDNIKGDLARGFISFDVKVVALVAFRSGIWRSRSQLCKASCRNMTVSISSTSYSGGSGELVGGSRKCLVVEGLLR